MLLFLRKILILAGFSSGGEEGTEWRQAKLHGPQLLPQPAEGCCEWQLWSYSPALVRGTHIVDPPSLTLSHEQRADERVQMAHVT